MNKINTTTTTGEPVTEQAPTVDTLSTISTDLFGVCHRSIRSLAETWDISEDLLGDRLKSGMEMCVALVVKNDAVELMFIGLDGKARYKLPWSENPQTAREIIEHYRPDLLQAYDKYNPTGKYEPYIQDKEDLNNG